MGKIFTFSGPRGVGKTTIVEGLRDIYGIEPIVPYTTRDPRPTELDGREYKFVSDDEFTAVRRTRGMFDVLTLGKNRYGTPLEEFEHVLEAPDGTLEGIRTVNLAASSAVELKKEMGSSAVKSLFILPRSWGDIDQQMRDKGIPELEIAARRAAEPTDLTMLPHFDRLILNGYGKEAEALYETASYIGKMAGIELGELTPVATN